MAVDPKAVHTECQRSIFIERGFRSFDFAQDDIVRDKDKMLGQHLYYYSN